MKGGIKQEGKTSIDGPVYIVGNIKAEGDLVLNGRLKGNVEIINHNFILGPSGRLKGNINGQDLIIQGHMQGDIDATGKVEITREAKFSGKITGKSISVEKGAFFDADVNFRQESPGKETSEENVIEKPIN
jgi:cytoskeletal protein CcmA (bactofilin family)